MFMGGIYGSINFVLATEAAEKVVNKNAMCTICVILYKEFKSISKYGF